VFSDVVPLLIELIHALFAFLPAAALWTSYGYRMAAMESILLRYGYFSLADIKDIVKLSFALQAGASSNN